MAVLGDASRVANGVDNAPGQVDHAQSRGNERKLDTGNTQGQQEARKSFQVVLVATLNAVEDGFGIGLVHGRIVDIVLLASSPDAVASFRSFPLLWA